MNTISSHAPAFSPGTSEHISPPANALARVALDAKDGDGFELWHAACRPVMDISNREPLRRFDAALEFYEVDGLLFNRTRYSAAAFRRTTRHLRSGDNDPLILHMLLRGDENGEVEGGCPLRMDANRIVLHDWAHPFASIAQASEQLCVVIPRERLQGSLHLHARRPVVSWDLHSPSGRILGTALRETWSCLPQATRMDAPALAAGFLGLLDGLLDPSRSEANPQAPDQTLSSAMRTFLETRLANPSLGINDLAAGFRCSRSTIYRLFRGFGGVRAYLTEIRLAKAFRMLTASQSTRKPSVASIALSLGFRDPSYFHRAFRRRYGLTPTEAARFPKEQCLLPDIVFKNPTTIDSLSTLHNWMGTGI